MLHAILHELQIATEPLTLRQLSLRLGVQESALEGMLQFWEAKGRLRLEKGWGGETQVGLCASRMCFRKCSGPDACPLVMKASSRYRLT